MMDNKYNLEDRTLDFSVSVISFCKTIKIDMISRNIIDQLLRAATSVGANYREANGAVSKKDFSNKIHICKKEVKESYYWLKLLEKLIEKERADEMKEIMKECKELLLIFSKIASSSKEN